MGAGMGGMGALTGAGASAWAKTMDEHKDKDSKGKR
jgi:hypothetical protein